MDSFPIFGASRARACCLSLWLAALVPSFSIPPVASRIPEMPVASMNAGSLNGGLSSPRLPAR